MVNHWITANNWLKLHSPLTSYIHQGSQPYLQNIKISKASTSQLVRQNVHRLTVLMRVHPLFWSVVNVYSNVKLNKCHKLNKWYNINNCTRDTGDFRWLGICIWNGKINLIFFAFVFRLIWNVFVLCNLEDFHRYYMILY